MTSVGKITQTTFEINPRQEIVKIDPYKPEQLNTLNAAEAAVTTEINTLEGKVTADQYAALSSDASAAAKAAELGLTLEQYASKVESKLPSSVNLKDALQSKLSLPQISDVTDRLKVSFDSKGVSTSTPTIFTKVLGYVSNASKIVDLDKYSSEVQKAKELGVNLTDEVSESSLGLGLLDAALDKAKDSEVWQYIEGTGVGDQFTEYMVKEGIEIAAKKGSYSAVKEILTKYPGQISENRKYKAVLSILQNFRLQDEDLSAGYFKSAKRVVDALDFIYPNWRYTQIGYDNMVFDQTPWLTANRGACDLLRYDQRTAIPAAVQFELRLTQKTYQQIVPEFFKTVLIFDK